MPDRARRGVRASERRSPGAAAGRGPAVRLRRRWRSPWTFRARRSGIQSDEATYYMMGHSLAEDGDLTYRREDLVRVWREFPSGPTGRVPEEGTDDRALRPDAAAAVLLDRDPRRHRSEPLLLRQVVRLSAVRGAVRAAVRHERLSGAPRAAAGARPPSAATCSSRARMRPAVAATLAGAFVMASVVPVYFVWITPELFNFTLGVLAYFCWLYKEVARRSRPRAGARWLFRPRSDVVAALLLGLATFSKVSNALHVSADRHLACCGGGDGARRSRRRVAFARRARSVCSPSTWRSPVSGTIRAAGSQHVRLRVSAPDADVRVRGRGAEGAQRGARRRSSSTGRVFWTNLTHNLGYIFVGRYAGIVPYFFPAAFAILAFLAAPRRRPMWQWLVLCGGLAQLLFFCIGTPYTWLGGGGSVGNRYFMGAYGAFLFLLPPISSVGMAVVPWIVGGLFVAPLVLNPFVASFYPGSYAAHGPFRMLPVELTLVYDWPINTDRLARARVVRRQRRAARSRVSDLLLRRQRVWQGAGQELLGEGRVPRGVPDQDRSTDETPGPDAHRRRAERRGRHGIRPHAAPVARRRRIAAAVLRARRRVSRIRASGRCGRRRSRAAPGSSPLSTSHRAPTPATSACA